MKKIKLGLPLDYKIMPEYFDALNVHDDTEAKNLVVEKLLKSHNVKTVLDLTCGTGSQVFFLTKHGYKVTGADFSPALLESARKRSQSEKVNIKFIDGDMRTLKVGTFDAVITMFNAIGHLTKIGFEKAIKNIYRNLNPGGIYIFDILNLDAMTDKTIADLAYYIHKKIDNTQIHTTQCSTVDKTNGILTSYDSYMLQKNADTPKRFFHKFSLQIYNAKELREMLSKNGFKTLAQYGIDGTKFLEHKTTNILTVAKKQ